MAIDLTADAAIFGADFGEQVTYRPHQRSARVLTSVNVIREDPSLLPGMPSGMATPQFVVLVPNSAETGISRDELDLGRDLIEFPAEVGGATQRRKITNVLTQDAGMLQLIVR